MMTKLEFSQTLRARLRILYGDITKIPVDAIVNAANKYLVGGGGVDGAIQRAGGPNILAECQTWVQKHGLLPTGQAMLTTAGKLPARVVIHTVGPIWSGKATDAEELAACYTNCCRLAAEQGISTLSFPNISTGVYGYPWQEAAQIASETLRECLERYESIAYINVVCFKENAFAYYRELWGENVLTH